MLHSLLEACLITEPSESHVLDLVFNLEMSVFASDSAEVLVNLVKTVDFGQLDHFLMPLLGELILVLLLLPHEVDRGFDRVPPIGPCISLDWDVVGRPQLQVAILVDRHGVPGEELRHILDVFQDFFID